MILKSFLEQFVLLFRPDSFRELARKTVWFKRKGKIDPFDFLISLIFGQMSALRLTLISQAQSFPEPVSRQGIDQRYTPAAVAFLKASFDHVLVQTLDWSRVPSQTEALREHFSAVYLVDSTCFDCPETLKAFLSFLRRRWLGRQREGALALRNSFRGAPPDGTASRQALRPGAGPERSPILAEERTAN
jgi:hypothetical protein